MGPLRYSINITLDGCCDHREGVVDEDLHRNAIENIARAEALLFGRITYQMMEEAWRPVAETGVRPDWMPAWMEAFAETIHRAKKYVVSTTLREVSWNAELVHGNLAQAVAAMKERHPGGVMTGGVTLPRALAGLDLIDEYELVVHPRVVGHGPVLFEGLAKPIDLTLVSQSSFRSGAVAMRYLRARP